jgi:hypothetical protein
LNHPSEADKHECIGSQRGSVNFDGSKPSINSLEHRGLEDSTSKTLSGQDEADSWRGKGETAVRAMCGKY